MLGTAKYFTTSKILMVKFETTTITINSILPDDLNTALRTHGVRKVHNTKWEKSGSMLIADIVGA